MIIAINSLKLHFEDKTVVLAKEPVTDNTVVIPETSFNNLAQISQESMLMNCYSDQVLKYTQDPVKFFIAVLVNLNVYNCKPD